jgi:uncharacterized membrane protein
VRELSIELFNDYAGLIVFLHVISAVIWVGGMVAIRFAVYQSMQEIDEPKIKIARTLDILKRFLNIVRHLIGVILITAVIMILAIGFKGTDLNVFVHIKETIWLLMTILYVTIYIKRNKAQMYLESHDLISAKASLAPITTWMIPLNIILGIVAIYLGVTLRGY